MFHSLLQDLRHSARQLWRKPLFTLTAVLMLAIGMGVNAVAFTVVNGLLLRESPVKSAGTGRIRPVPDGNDGNVSLDEYRRFADGTRRATRLSLIHI